MKAAYDAINMRSYVLTQHMTPMKKMYSLLSVFLTAIMMVKSNSKILKKWQSNISVEHRLSLALETTSKLKLKNLPLLNPR